MLFYMVWTLNHISVRCLAQYELFIVLYINNVLYHKYTSSPPTNLYIYSADTLHGDTTCNGTTHLAIGPLIDTRIPYC